MESKVKKWKLEMKGRNWNYIFEMKNGSRNENRKQIQETEERG